MFKRYFFFCLQSYYCLHTWCSYVIRQYITSAVDTSLLNKSIRYRIVCSVYVRLSWSVSEWLHIRTYRNAVSALSDSRFLCKLCLIFIEGETSELYWTQMFILQVLCLAQSMHTVPSSLVISLHVTAVNDVGVRLIVVSFNVLCKSRYAVGLLFCVCGSVGLLFCVCGSDGLPSFHLPAVRDKPKIYQLHCLVLSLHCIFVTFLFNPLNTELNPICQ